MSLTHALIGLFSAAFLAATVLPAQSEGILVWLLSLKKYNPVWLLAAATAGNVAGAAVNWWLGKYAARFRDKKWFPFSPAEFAKAERFFQKYGVWSLLLAWVPIVGDPLTLAAGALGVRFLPFALLVTLGKLGRYGAIYWAASGLF